MEDKIKLSGTLKMQGSLEDAAANVPANVPAQLVTHIVHDLPDRDSNPSLRTTMLKLMPQTSRMTSNRAICRLRNPSLRTTVMPQTSRMPSSRAICRLSNPAKDPAQLETFIVIVYGLRNRSVGANTLQSRPLPTPVLPVVSRPRLRPLPVPRRLHSGLMMMQCTASILELLVLDAVSPKASPSSSPRALLKAKDKTKGSGTLTMQRILEDAAAMTALALLVALVVLGAACPKASLSPSPRALQ